MAKICIICEKEPRNIAYKVRDDMIIKTIRTIKQKIGIAKNNELYVDEDCLSVYREKRKKFEKNIVFYIAIGTIFFILVNGFQLIYGRFSLGAFVASIFLCVLITVFPVLNYATPPIENDSQNMSTQTQKQQINTEAKEKIKKNKKTK